MPIALQTLLIPIFCKQKPTSFAPHTVAKTKQKTNLIQNIHLPTKKIFTKKGQNLTAEVKFIDNWEHSYQLFTQNAFKKDGAVDAEQTILQNSINDEYEKKLDIPA